MTCLACKDSCATPQLGMPLLPEVSAAFASHLKQCPRAVGELELCTDPFAWCGSSRVLLLGSCVRPYRCATYVTLRGTCVGSDELKRCRDPWLAMWEQTLTLLLSLSHQPAGFLEVRIRVPHWERRIWVVIAQESRMCLAARHLQ